MTIKNKRWHLGDKLHTRIGEEGFVEQIQMFSVNVADADHL